MRDVTTILLTHIHLDHAGATGARAAAPGLRVFVHERCASPGHGKLLASAARLYGDAMDRQWVGLPFPPAMTLLPGGGGGARATGRSTSVRGHASLTSVSSIAIRGAQSAIPPASADADGFVMPPTPPDVDLEAWRGTSHIERWRRRCF
jgi:hypothetical protein